MYTFRRGIRSGPVLDFVNFGPYLRLLDQFNCPNFLGKKTKFPLLFSLSPLHLFEISISSLPLGLSLL